MSGARPGAVHARRVRFLGASLVAVGVACVVRAAQLQLVESDRWRERALAQSEPSVEIPARRGSILDRHGRALVIEAEEYRAYFAPREAADAAAAVQTITRLLDLSRSQARALRSAREGWVAIPRRLSPVERDRLHRALGRGVHFERLSSRAFPEGRLAAALLGSVGPDGRGRSGLERVLDAALRGEPGSALERRDAKGETYRLPGALLEPPRPGHDVWLTLDAELQGIAEEALQRALRETGASGGDVLLADPRTGELLAVASVRAEGSERIPAFTDPFEPGSTVKPFLLAALLAERKAALSDPVYAEHGVWREGRRTIRDVHAYDTLTVAEVIRYSSNIGAAKLARRLEPGEQYRWLRDFGFGTPSGIEYPAESAGLLRRPEQWSALSQSSLAFGYELMVTSVQMVAAYGALANGGVLMRPGLVREVRGPDGEVVWRRSPEPLRRVLPPGLADSLTRVLASAVEPGGTAVQAAMATLPVAGKTGTARIASAGGYGERRYAASFVGYTPVEDPKLVILAKLEDPQARYYGGQTAAPLSRTVIQAALATRGVELRAPQPAPEWRWETPADPFRLVAERGDAGEATGEPGGPGGRPPGGGGPAAADRSGLPLGDRGRVVLPDLRGLSVRAAAARLHGLGLAVELEASGRVSAQEPSPGRALAPGETVRLR